MKINIKNQGIRIYIFLLILSFFWPIEHANSITSIIRWGTIGIAAGFSFLFLAKQNFYRYKVSNVVWLWLLYYFVLFFTSWVNSDKYASLDTILSIIRFAGLLIIVDFTFRNFSEISIPSAFYAIATIVVWDIIGILTNPLGIFLGGRTYNGVYYNTSIWLLGNKNNHSTYFITFIFLAYWNYLNKKNWFNRLLLILSGALSLIASVLLGSSTTISVVFVAILGIIISHFYYSHARNKLFSIPFKRCFFYFFVVNIILYIGNLAFLSPITQLFGKTTTFSSRTIIWKNVIPMIAKKPIFGWGNIDFSFLTNYLGIDQAYNAHNQILDTSLRGGIVLLVVLIFVMMKTFTSIDLINDKRAKIVGYFFIIAIMAKMLFEQMLSGYLTGLLFLLFYHFTYFHMEDS